LDPKGGHCSQQDIPLIARGHAAAEAALVRQANRVLICDTDALTTTLWSEMLFNNVPEEVLSRANAAAYDMTLLLSPDCPWVDDGTRFHSHRRLWFHGRCIEELNLRKRPFVEISGEWDERFRKACAAIDRLLGAPLLRTWSTQ